MLSDFGDLVLNTLTGSNSSSRENQHQHHSSRRNREGGASVVSYHASHTDLTKEHERLEDYYDEISKSPNSSRFKQTFLAKHRASGEYRGITKLSKKRVSAKFFWDEVEVYKSLYHPNVLHLYETFQDRDYYYFCVDRLDHPNLYQAIPRLFKNPSDFDEKQVALVVRTILKTLVYCHSKGIVHSDLTYENILLDPSKGGGLRSLYIAGFGYARLTREYRNYHHRSSRSSHHHSSGGCAYSQSSDEDSSSDDDDSDDDSEERVAVGDLFAAPETRCGDLSFFGEAADLWSLGLITYQLLARRHPFEDGKILPRHFDDPMWKALHFDSSPYLKHVSTEGKDFISKLLVYEAEGRPSAAEAFQHEWLTIAEGKGKRVRKEALVDCLTNLQNFHANTMLEKSARMYIVSNLLHRKERAQLDACFRYLDKNKNNVITKDELRRALFKAHGKDKCVKIETMLEATFDRLDVQKTGRIEYTEFLAAAADDSLVLTRENLYATFHAFDRSHTGTITVDDLMEVFNEGREKRVLRTRDAKRLLKQVDGNGDGEINFEEFCELMHATGG